MTKQRKQLLKKLLKEYRQSLIKQDKVITAKEYQIRGYSQRTGYIKVSIRYKDRRLRSALKSRDLSGIIKNVYGSRGTQQEFFSDHGDYVNLSYMSVDGSQRTLQRFLKQIQKKLLANIKRFR